MKNPGKFTGRHSRSHVLVQLAIAIILSSIGLHARGGATFTVSQLASGAIGEDTELTVRGYIVGFFDTSTGEARLGRVPSGAGAGRWLLIADTRDAMESSPLCIVTPSLSGSGVMEDLHLGLHPDIYLAELTYHGIYYVSYGMPRVAYLSTTEYTLTPYDGGSGSDEPVPAAVYMRGTLNGEEGALVRMHRSEETDSYSALFAEGLDGRWVISDESGSWTFGAADGGMLETGSTADAWFGGHEFTTSISGPVRITFRYIPGSAKAGSDIPSVVMAEGVEMHAGTADSPYRISDISALLSAATTDEGPKGVFVQGYIVGHIDGTGTPVMGTYSDSSVRTLLLADTPDESDTRVMAVLKLRVSGTQRTDLGLDHHPEHLGALLTVSGNLWRQSSASYGLHSVEDITEYRVTPSGLYISRGAPGTYAEPMAAIDGGFERGGFAIYPDIETGSPETDPDAGPHGYVLLSTLGPGNWHQYATRYGATEGSTPVTLDRGGSALVSLRAYHGSEPMTPDQNIILPEGTYRFFANVDTFSPTLSIVRESITVGLDHIISADSRDTVPDTSICRDGVSAPDPPAPGYTSNAPAPSPESSSSEIKQINNRGNNYQKYFCW